MSGGAGYTTYFRALDPRIGRWLTPDPKVFPWQSPYVSMDGNPVALIDPWGASTDGPDGGGDFTTGPASGSDGGRFSDSHVSAKDMKAIQNIDRRFLDSMVDMNGSNKPNWNSRGWPRDNQYFWKEFQNTSLGREALSEKNLLAINSKEFRSPSVDDQWNNSMGKYGLDGKNGEVIEAHHHEKGQWTYGRPKSKHTSKGFNQNLHKMHMRYGKARQTSGYFAKKAMQRGTFRSGFKMLLSLEFPMQLMLNPPHSPLYMFGHTGELNRAFYSEDNGCYFEILNINDDRSEMTIQLYEGYEYIGGQWRGVLPIGNPRTFIKKHDGNVMEML